MSVALADIRPPGVWVQVVSFRPSRLDGSVTFAMELVLIVQDQAPRRAMDALAQLLDQVLPVVEDIGGPAGPIRAATVAPPEGVPLPALVVPLNVTADTTPPDPDPAP